MHPLIPLLLIICAGAASAGTERPGPEHTSTSHTDTSITSSTSSVATPTESLSLDSLIKSGVLADEDANVHEAMVASAVQAATAFTDLPTVAVSPDQNSQDVVVTHQTASVSQTMYAIIGVCGMVGVGAIVTGFLVWKHKTYAQGGNMPHLKNGKHSEKDLPHSRYSADPATMELSILKETHTPIVIDLEQGDKMPNASPYASPLESERLHPCRQVRRPSGAHHVSGTKATMGFISLNLDPNRETRNTRHSAHSESSPFSPHDPDAVNYQQAKAFMTHDIKKILQDSGHVNSRASAASSSDAQQDTQ